MDVERRLAAYALVLRELVHDALARIAEEPWLHEKRTLAAHAHDDAQAVAALLERLRSGAPAVAVLEGREAYAEVKPGLAAALREHVATLNLLEEEADAQLLSGIADRQDLHLMERPVRHPLPAAPFELPDGTGAGPLRVLPAPDAPARDPFIEEGHSHDGAHAQLNATIIAGEVAARTAHEHPQAPWDFHADLARLARDRLAATAALDQQLAAEGRRWGDEPVSLGGWSAVLALDLGGRLAFAADPGDPDHARIADRWGRS
jgi:hypothetical protein